MFPLDSDNDLITVAGRTERAQGTPLYLDGLILDAAGREVADARVQIWQADFRGRYHHPRARGSSDPNFQAYGRTETNADGPSRFRPTPTVAYPRRPPHLPFPLAPPRARPTTTQTYTRTSDMCE